MNFPRPPTRPASRSTWPAASPPSPASSVTPALLAVRDFLAGSKDRSDKALVKSLDAHLRLMWLNGRDDDLEPMTWNGYRLLAVNGMTMVGREIVQAAA